MAEHVIVVGCSILVLGSTLGCDAPDPAPCDASGPSRDDDGESVVDGDLEPLFFEFTPISATPNGFETWRVVFGTQLTGGLNGTTDDLEYQILAPDGSGEINGVGTFTGDLEGHEGGFIFESVGTQQADGTFQTEFEVKTQAAWGDLEGLRGKGEVIATRDHCEPDDTPDTCLTLVSYTFRFDLADAVEG